MSDCRVPMPTYEKPDITAVKIVEDYLKSHGYDGLCCPDAGCGCRLGDLAPCCDGMDNCTPGYLIECEECGEAGTSSWCVSPTGDKPCAEVVSE